MEKCPHCEAPLELIEEDYSSIGTYRYIEKEDRYVLESGLDIREEIKYICPYCRSRIPSKIVKRIIPKLPRII